MKSSFSLSILLISLLLLVTGCDLVKDHPYQVAEHCHTGLTLANITELEALGRGRDTLRFAMISDTQRRYGDTHDAVDYINAHPDLQFVLHGGDLTDFGVADEFVWMSDELCRLHCPWVAVIGNHDFLGTGEDNYAKIFGPYNFSFNVGHLHVVALNTVSRDCDLSLSVPDFAFLDTDIASVRELNLTTPDSITHTVLLMHDRPGDDQFNNNEMLPFALYLHQYPGLGEGSPLLLSAEYDEMVGTRSMGFCLNGHGHNFDLSRSLGDSTLFISAPAIQKREVQVFTIYPDGYAFERQTF